MEGREKTRKGRERGQEGKASLGKILPTIANTDGQMPDISSHMEDAHSSMGPICLSLSSRGIRTMKEKWEPLVLVLAPCAGEWA